MPRARIGVGAGPFYFSMGCLPFIVIVGVLGVVGVGVTMVTAGGIAIVRHPIAAVLIASAAVVIVGGGILLVRRYGLPRIDPFDPFLIVVALAAVGGLLLTAGQPGSLPAVVVLAVLLAGTVGTFVYRWRRRHIAAARSAQAQQNPWLPGQR